MYSVLRQWTQPSVFRKNIKGLLPVDSIIPWWNVEKT